MIDVRVYVAHLYRYLQPIRLQWAHQSELSYNYNPNESSVSGGVCLQLAAIDFAIIASVLLFVSSVVVYFYLLEFVLACFNYIYYANNVKIIGFYKKIHNGDLVN